MGKKCYYERCGYLTHGNICNLPGGPCGCVSHVPEPLKGKTEPVDEVPCCVGLSLPPVKKNCLNCKHLEEWSDTDTDGHNTVGGLHCEKQYQKAEERGTDIQHEYNMNREEYLKKGKVCFEPKQR